jgi:energy-coupling factor transporter ATP-binding protein EcfA2
MESADTSQPGNFETWLANRPKWLQAAASQLVDLRRQLTGAEIVELAQLCIAEATALAGPVYRQLQPGALAGASARQGFRIVSLSEVRGINALKDGAGIELGTESIGVIYGPNGSGKTGFARLLKQMCGTRSKEDILGNVFDAANPVPSATVTLKTSGDAQPLRWQLNSGALRELRHVHIFDSRTAQAYVTERNEATYEPSRMRFVSTLISICDQVATHLRKEREKLVNKLPTLPPTLSQTRSANWLRTLTASTKRPDIVAATTYTVAMNEQRIAGEAALQEKDIPGRLLVVAREITALGAIRISTEAWREGLSDVALSQLISARKEATKKRKIASEDAKLVFEGAPLQGVGLDAWMALWQHAKTYSELHAFPNIAFPSTAADARCVLCQQPLLPEGRRRMSHFQSFVVGSLEAEAKQAEDRYVALVSKLPAVPAPENWAAQSSLLRLDGIAAEQYLSDLSSRARLAVSANQVAELPSVDWATVTQAVRTAFDRLTAEEKSLKQLLQDDKRKELEKRLLELQAQHWLSENKQAIEGEVIRLSAVAGLDKAERLTSTMALTRKNGELAEQELDAGYQDRFAQELKLLGGKRLRVKPESKKAGKGRVTFGLVIEGAKRSVPVNAVLSEGEMRIVALAAFLADITGAPHQTPFIFDDPISSLDQDFEERVVSRLINLCKSRQVLVFTHRLSLVTLVSDAIKKFDAQAKAQKALPEVSLRVEHLRRLGGFAGIAAQMNARDAKPPSVLNRMRAEAIPQIKKLRDQGDVQAYDERINGVCSDFRIVVERTVETILLGEVVLRFRRSVETKGRIANLAKIRSSDCALIDELMTRYSAFEHSQPDELPAQCPDIEEIDSDVTKLAVWVAEFGSRAAP